MTRGIIIGVGGMAFTLNGHDQALGKIREHPKQKLGYHSSTS